MVNVDLSIRVAFKQTDCIEFCEKVQTHGYYFHLSSLFSLSLKGNEVKVGDLEFTISKETISQATRISLLSKSWFKGMELDASHYKDFVKPQYKGKYGPTFPRNYMLKHHSKPWKVIQRYFTCEGHFSRGYQYHIRLLMHLTRKRSLNLPRYLFKSVGKVAEKSLVQGRESLSQFVPLCTCKMVGFE